MKKLVAVLSFLIVLFSINSLALAGGDCSKDPRDCFDGFRDDDSIITRDKKAEKTFAMPPLKVGFVVDFYNEDILPHLSVELVDFKIPYAGDFTLDTGVATSRIFASLTWEVIPIIKAGPSVWIGYNVKDNDPAFGLGVTILDF